MSARKHDDNAIYRLNVYEPIPCKFCKTLTPMTFTGTCTDCWELESRISRNIKKALRILFRVILDRLFGNAG